MLTIEQWNELHPDKFSYCSFKNSCLWPGDRIIAEGMLKFTDETAHCWAGPFEGGYAHCVVRDYTNSTYAGGPKKGKNYLKCIDE